MVSVPCRRFVVKQIFWNPGRTILFLICLSSFLVFYFHNETECRKNRTLQGGNERTSSFYERTRGLDNNKDNVEENTKQRIYCFLFIIILAAPTTKSKERRDVIRKTWLSNIGRLDQKIVAKFVVGTSGSEISEQQRLRGENKVYDDMLLLPHLRDSYHNLTMKVLQAFIWINTRIKPVYVLKADDDTFVRIDRLISELNTMNPTTNLYWGFFRGDANVKKHGPWAERKWVLCDKYLPYANGGGYVLSASLVEFIARNADLLQLYNSEDVSVGTWIAGLKVTRLHDPRFDTEYKSRGCHNQHIVSHKQSREDMIEKHKQLNTKGQLCVQETHLRNSFRYDWTVPPSKCCKRVPGVP